MKQTLIALLGTALIALGVSGFAGSGYDDRNLGREDDRDDEDPRRRAASVSPPTGGTAAQARYQSECGGCHLAYPPRLLPATAWGRVMGTLDNHFGDDAGLDQGIADDLLAYIQAEAADANPLRGPPPRLQDQTGEDPPRITQTRSFLNQHDEVPARLAFDNPEVRSFSNCQACHRGAAQGRFDEDEVSIPGVGRWDD
jgi:hypothetical protein